MLDTATTNPTKTADPGSSPKNTQTPAAPTTAKRNLKSTAHQDGLPEAAESLHRELHPDAEEEEHDPDLGEHLDLVGVVDEAERGRTGQHAGEDESGDGRNAEPPQHGHYQDRRRQHDDQIL